MVEKFNTILHDIVSKHKGVYVFAIMKMDDVVDKWAIVLSAPWINDQNLSNVFVDIQGLLIKYLSKDELNNISRIAIYERHEHLIEALLNFQKGAEINDQQINGNMVYKGHVLESDKNPK